MSGRSTFEGFILVRTPKAILFNGHFWEGPLWFPTSQIDIVSGIDCLESVIHVKSWLCQKRGIHEFTHYSEEEITRISES